jgi:hypothetical protein
MKRNLMFASTITLLLILIPFLSLQSRNLKESNEPVTATDVRPAIEPIVETPTLPPVELVEAQPVAPLPAPEPVPEPAPPAPAPVFTGGCEDWIAAAGIGDVYHARELIRRESGCNPYAMNSSSGACGVAQELPCGKSGCQLGDGACQVSWMNRYVLGRYGSWAAAIAWHNKMNWY